MKTIIIESEDKAITKKIIAFLKEMKVKYSSRVGKTDHPENNKSPYNQDFVKMILTASQEKGGKIVNPDNLWESIK